MILIAQSVALAAVLGSVVGHTTVANAVSSAVPSPSATARSAALSAVAVSSEAPSGDSVPVVRRLAATARLAAQEYRVGVSDGRIVAPAEVEEARLFFGEARRSADLLPASARPSAVTALDELLDLVAETSSPDSIDARVQKLVGVLAEQLHIVLDEIPTVPPSLALGAEVYRTSCASCHGTLGAGDGPAAAGLDPPPADLTDADALRDQSPLDFYHRITIGVMGTAMPSFEGTLTAADRWAAAAYATLLRLPAPAGDIPVEWQNFPAAAKMSDAALLAALGGSGNRAATLARLAAVRSVQIGAGEGATAGVFERVRSRVDSALVLGRQREGDAAAATALDAYMMFEQVEASVRASDPALASELEVAFASLRTGVTGAASSDELDSLGRHLAAGLEQAERGLGESLSPLNLFVQSLVLLLREGLEAILIVGALLTFLTKTGAGHRRRDIHIGVGVAIAMSFVTAVALETLFDLSAASREVLEGAMMLLATAVLFYVSYWLLSKMEVMKWNHFVRSKVQDAVTSGSSFALVMAAFLAVYREGFETVLFYKALFLAGDGGGAMAPIVSGMVVGGIALMGVYVAISRFGVRLPLKPFFAATSAFLYYMALVFAGKGIAELQEGGIISTTVVSWAPRVPALGIYPTAESLGLQFVLVGFLIVALVWTFVLEPRQLRRKGRKSIHTEAESAPSSGPDDAGARLSTNSSIR